MIVCLSSVAGSPGVTSWSLLLGAAWPRDYGVDRVVVEAGRDGGVLGARYPAVGVEPGVAALAAAIRRHELGQLLPMTEFARKVADGLWVVPQPESAEASSLLWSTGSTTSVVATALAADARVWLVDAGRCGPGSPAVTLSASSAMSLVWSGVTHEELVGVPARVRALQRPGTPVGVVLVGTSGYQPDDLRRFFGTGLVWSVPTQRDLPAWVSAVLAGGRARRSWLWRQALIVAADVAERTTARGDLDPVTDGDLLDRIGVDAAGPGGG